MYRTYIGYRELKLRYSLTPWCIQITLNTNSRTQKSEFSGAWCKRGEGRGGEGRQGREGFQLPDSLMDEAVLQSVGPGLETPQSPP